MICVIETGLSDFLKMIVSVMRTNFQRLVQYRDYTQFSNDILGKNLSLENINTNINGLEKIFQVCINTHDQMAPGQKIHIKE